MQEFFEPTDHKTEVILMKIPVIKQVLWLTKQIKLPGLEGLTFYDFIKLYLRGILQGTFSPRASSIAYSFFVAIFPFLLFILNLIPYIPIAGFQSRFLIFIEEFLPPHTADFFYPVIADIAKNPRGGLLSFVFLLSIFLAANGVNAIFSAFEYSYHVTINRGFFKQYAVALGVSVLFAVALIITVILILYGEYVIRDLQGRAFISKDLFWVAALQVTVFVVLLYTTISTLYYFGTKEEKSSRFFSLGALVTTLLFLATTYFFGIYINNFSTYNELYGSLGALLIMLLYIWINSNLLLLGFELNITLQRLRNNQNQSN
jgi:membrane protein